MPQKITYKNFNEEEDKMYNRFINLIRENVSNGLKFNLACNAIDVEDKDLKKMIIADALKIEIAELYYGKGLPLIDVSKKLGVPMERLLKANEEMLEDIVHSKLKME